MIVGTLNSLWIGDFSILIFRFAWIATNCKRYFKIREHLNVYKVEPTIVSKGYKTDYIIISQILWLILLY